MKFRSIKRVMRLRLVNRSFDAEMMRVLMFTPYLEYLQIPISDMGIVGAEFMAHRLLRTKLPVCPRWARFPRIARKLAAEDDETEESYEGYVSLLCHRAAYLASSHYIKNLCDGKCRDESWDIYTEELFDYDLLCAAAYTNKLSIIERYENDGRYMGFTGGLGDPYENAIKGDHHAVVDLLFTKCLQQGERIYFRQITFIQEACFSGNMTMVQKFLPDWPEFVLNDPHSQFSSDLENSMETPNVEVFEMLRRIKEGAQRPKIQGHLLGRIFERICKNGWEEMARHLIGLGAVTNPSMDGPRYKRPLVRACEGGHVGVVRILMETSGMILDGALEVAAEKQHWHVVWLLIDEYGADPNLGRPPVIVFAVLQEREDLLYDLMSRGAKLEGDSGIEAVKAARKYGLESMLDTLGSHGVDIDSGREQHWAQNAIPSLFR